MSGSMTRSSLTVSSARTQTHSYTPCCIHCYRSRLLCTRKQSQRQTLYYHHTWHTLTYNIRTWTYIQTHWFACILNRAWVCDCRDSWSQVPERRKCSCYSLFAWMLLILETCWFLYVIMACTSMYLHVCLCVWEREKEAAHTHRQDDVRVI